MKRHQIIYALRKWAHPTWFQEILAWPTPMLRLILEEYEPELFAH